jgi:hypothetical protein
MLRPQAHKLDKEHIMEEKVSFQSDGLKIAGLIDTPAEHKAGERRPAFLSLHGVGGH